MSYFHINCLLVSVLFLGTSWGQEKAHCPNSDEVQADGTVIGFEPMLIPDVQVDRFQWGFDLKTRYDTNLTLAPEGQELDGFVYSFSPDVLFRILGDDFTEHNLALAYGADFINAERLNQSEVNHDVDLLYRYQTGRTQATLSTNYRHIAGNFGRGFDTFGDALFLREELRSTSDQVSVNLDVTYDLSACLEADFSYGYHNYDFDNLNDFSSHGGQFALMYGGDCAITKFGPFIGHESVESDNNPDQQAFQFGGRASWKYSEITSFFGQAGYETRSFDGVNAIADREMFVWVVGMNWNPDEWLSGRLSLDRRALPSVANNDQNFEQTAIRWGLRKQFMDCYYGRLIGSVAWTDYQGTTAATQGFAREDDYVSSYFEIGRELCNYGELGVFVNLLDNDSTIQNGSFSNESYGVRLSVDF